MAENDRFKKGTTRYWNGEVDLDSIIAFISHLKEEDKLPHSLIRLRGVLRNAFPGFQTNKNLIREAYEKAGWDIDELMDITKKQVRGRILCYVQKVSSDCSSL